MLAISRTVFPFIIALDPKGRALMTRDMELIRKIFIEILKRKDVRPSPLEIDGFDEVAVARHLEMLLSAGLIEGQKSVPLDRGILIVLVKDLSWQGHDFAATLLNDDVWSTIKKKLSVSQLSELPLTVIKSVGVKLLEGWLSSQLGLG
jgi:Hypothetical protein (DUF2513)